MSGAVSRSVSALLSDPPDPHRCPHPEGCSCRSVGEFGMQSMRDGEGKGRQPDKTTTDAPWEEKRAGLTRGGVRQKFRVGAGDV